MKAILKFKLPEEADDHKLAVQASSWYLTAWDLDQFLRNLLKHGSAEGVDLETLTSPEDALEATRTFLHEILQHRNLSLDT